MIAIDTNILVRYLVRDDPAQETLAKRLLQDEMSETEPGFVPLATIVELAWVLVKVYKIRAEAVRLIVAQLLSSPQLMIEQALLVERALALELPDLGDAIIHEAGKAAGCNVTMTFDRRFAQLDGVELLRA